MHVNSLRTYSGMHVNSLRTYSGMHGNSLRTYSGMRFNPVCRDSDIWVNHVRTHSGVRVNQGVSTNMIPKNLFHFLHNLNISSIFQYPGYTFINKLFITILFRFQETRVWSVDGLDKYTFEHQDTETICSTWLNHGGMITGWPHQKTSTLGDVIARHGT